MIDPRFAAGSLFFELLDGEAHLTLFGAGNGAILIDPRFAAGSLYLYVERRNGVGPLNDELRDGDDLLDVRGDGDGLPDVRGGGDGEGLLDLRGLDFLDIRARTREGSLGDNTTGVRLACW